MGGAGPGHFSGEGQALSLTTVIWHRFGLVEDSSLPHDQLSTVKSISFNTYGDSYIY